jgi:thioredoxin:protein disulfide reductase
MRILLAFILLFSSGSVEISAWAARRVVTIDVVKPSKPLVPGKPAKLMIQFNVASPYHINSNKPLDDSLKPTSVEFESTSGVHIGKAIFPAPQIRKLFSKNLTVFEGTVTVEVELTPAADLKQKEIDLRALVRYQACDDQVCLMPDSLPLEIKLPVDLTAALPAASDVKPAVVSADEKRPFFSFEDRSLLVIFLMVFLGGLALNLTPCVYPMIPITISYFGGQSQGKGSLFFHSLIYTVGMATTYSVLGVAAAMTGGLLGAALRYPAALISISCIMVLLALSMFDVYEFRMPAFLNRLAGGSQKGLIGTFLMGLTVGIVAAPCIGPFVLALLTYVGNKGNPVLGFLLFFTLAFGLGIPFLVLAFFSGSLQRLPRSGSWMIWVRKLFGFVLLGMAAYFLKPLFPNPLFYQGTIAAVLFLAGIYLAWIDPTQSEGKVFPIVRNAVGIVFFALAIYAAISGLQSQIESLAANPSRTADRPIQSGEKSPIQWVSYSDEFLAQASQQSKPIFIDFYADWCAPCKELDQYTFAAPEVVELSKKFIMLKADLTSADDPAIEKLIEKYQARGVPTLLFLKPDGEELKDLRGTGFETKEAFLLKMKRALQRMQSSDAI